MTCKIKISRLNIFFMQRHPPEQNATIYANALVHNYTGMANLGYALTSATQLRVAARNSDAFHQADELFHATIAEIARYTLDKIQVHCLLVTGSKECDLAGIAETLQRDARQTMHS